MKRKHIRIIKILFIFGVLVLLNEVLPHGIFDTFIGGLVGENTVYAEKYSEKAFQQIKLGDSEKKVISLVGFPIRKYIFMDADHWWYSISPTNGSFYVRSVRFSKEGIVIGIVHELRWD